MHGRLGARLILAAMVVGAACQEPEVCTLSGCAFEPWIRVTDEGTAGGHLRTGAYLLRLRSAHMTLEWACVVTIADAPDPACDRASLTAMGELDGAPLRWAVDVTHDVDGLAVTLVEMYEDSMTGPDELTITVIRDGDVEAEETHRPEYIGRWVNGVECGPYCAAASEPVVVRVPQ